MRMYRILGRWRHHKPPKSEGRMEERTQPMPTQQHVTENHGPEPSPRESPKRPYEAPRLTRLGSVRDLTFGASGHMPDMFGHQHGHHHP